MKLKFIHSVRFLKPSKFLLLLFVLSIGASATFAQMGNGIVMQPNRILGESIQHVDVSGLVIRCDSVNEIHLKVFNESNDTLGVNFDVTVINTSDGKTFTKSISITSMLPRKILQGSCSSRDSYSDLVIDLPNDFDPHKTGIRVIFK